MTTGDFWLAGFLLLFYYGVTWNKTPLVKLSTRWLCLWIAAARLAFLTEQGYFRFLNSSAYKLNTKQEEPWVLVLVLCSSGVIFMLIAPIVWIYRQWRNGLHPRSETKS